MCLLAPKCIIQVSELKIVKWGNTWVYYLWRINGWGRVLRTWNQQSLYSCYYQGCQNCYNLEPHLLNIKNSSDWLQNMAKINLEAAHHNSSLRLRKQMLFACQGRANRDHSQLGGQESHTAARIPKKLIRSSGEARSAKLVCAQTGVLNEQSSSKHEARTKELGVIRVCGSQESRSG